MQHSWSDIASLYNCPSCSDNIVLRSGKFGEFLSCEGYPKCRFTVRWFSLEDAIERLGEAGALRSTQTRKLISLSLFIDSPHTFSIAIPPHHPLVIPHLQTILSTLQPLLKTVHDFICLEKIKRVIQPLHDTYPGLNLLELDSDEQMCFECKSCRPGQCFEYCQLALTWRDWSQVAPEEYSSAKKIVLLRFIPLEHYNPTLDRLSSLKSNYSLKIDSIPYSTLHYFKNRLPEPSLVETEAHVESRLGGFSLFEYLLPFQKRGVEFCIQKKGRAIIADEMGLGKTVQGIGYLLCEKSFPALIVCTANMRETWLRECEKWLAGVISPCNISVVYSSNDMPYFSPCYLTPEWRENPLQKTYDHFYWKSAQFSLMIQRELQTQGIRHYRNIEDSLFSESLSLVSSSQGSFDEEEASHDPPLVMIISYAMLRIAASKIPLDYFQTVIADESHTLRFNTRALQPSATTQAVVSFAKNAPKCIFLTGTPFHAELHDIHLQVMTLKPNVLDRRVFRFMKDYCEYEEDLSEQNLHMRRSKELSILLRDSLMIRRLKKDIIFGVPALETQLVQLTINKADIEEYDVQITRGPYSYHEERFQEEAFPVFTQDDLASQASPHNTVKTIYELAGLSKVRKGYAWCREKFQLEGNATESKPHKLVFFVHHHRVLKELSRMLSEGQVRYVLIDGKTNNLLRASIVQQFHQDESIRVIVVSISAIAIGIDLSCSSTGVFFELPKNVGMFNQAMGRLHRRGQKALTVTIYVFLAANESTGGVLDDKRHDDMREEEKRERTRFREDTDGEEDNFIPLEVREMGQAVEDSVQKTDGSEIGIHEEKEASRVDSHTVTAHKVLEKEAELRIEAEEGFDKEKEQQHISEDERSAERPGESVIGPEQRIIDFEEECWGSRLMRQQGMLQKVLDPDGDGDGGEEERDEKKKEEDQYKEQCIKNVYNKVMEYLREGREQFECLNVTVSLPQLKVLSRFVSTFIDFQKIDQEKESSFENFYPVFHILTLNSEMCKILLEAGFFYLEYTQLSMEKRRNTKNILFTPVNFFTLEQQLSFHTKLKGKALPIEVSSTDEEDFSTFRRYKEMNSVDVMVDNEHYFTQTVRYIRKGTNIKPILMQSILSRLGFFCCVICVRTLHSKEFYPLLSEFPTAFQVPSQGELLTLDQYFHNQPWFKDIPVSIYDESFFFCSGVCRGKYFIKRNNYTIRQQLYLNDKGVCNICHLDCEEVMMTLRSLPLRERKAYLFEVAPPFMQYEKLSDKVVENPWDMTLWHADHITSKQDSD